MTRGMLGMLLLATLITACAVVLVTARLGCVQYTHDRRPTHAEEIR